LRWQGQAAQRGRARLVPARARDPRRTGLSAPLTTKTSWRFGMEVRSEGGTRSLERELAGKLSGAVMGAEHPRFDAARRIYNGLMDKVPALVARAADERDVARIVTFAQAHDLELAVRCTGHHIQGFATCEGGIVLDLQDLNAIHVDEQRGRVCLGG